MLTSRRSLVILSILGGLAASCTYEPASDPALRLSGTSSDPPYLVPLRSGVSFQALLSVGDPAINGYRMVGIPDGLGAFATGAAGSYVVLMNHELNATQGVVRAHGATGAFVSRWRIDTATGRVLSGEDLIQGAALWNPLRAAHDPPVTGIAFGRFCSGDLPLRSALYDDATGLGHDDRLYFNGEEIEDGRAFAHDVDTGIAWHLPRLGRMDFENVVARPSSGARTVVAATDDATPGEIVLYVGAKTASGSPVDRAGLTNGTLLGLVVSGYPNEPDDGIPSGTLVSTHDLGDVSARSAAQLQAVQAANGVTGFNRPEDIAWNPADPDQLIFVTTASFTGSTRLWRVNFIDGSDPAAGGTIDLLVDGATTSVDGVTPKMFDNIAVTTDGRWVYLQEDPGNQTHLAKIWRFDLWSNALELLAEHDPARFDPASPDFVTRDEESSGIIDASDILGPGTFLFDVQVHARHADPELVQHGQLLRMTVGPAVGID